MTQNCSFIDHFIQ